MSHLELVSVELHPAYVACQEHTWPHHFSCFSPHYICPGKVCNLYVIGPLTPKAEKENIFIGSFTFSHEVAFR